MDEFRLVLLMAANFDMCHSICSQTNGQHISGVHRAWAPSILAWYIILDSKLLQTLKFLLIKVRFTLMSMCCDLLQIAIHDKVCFNKQ